MARNRGTGYAKQDRKSQTAVGYVRRSTDRQEQSIPDQKRAIEAYAVEQGFRLLRFYEDDAISGTSTVGRRAFQSFVTDAKRTACEFGIVIVYDVKRFGRVDNDEAGYYRHVLRTHGVEVRYVSENFNGDGTDDLLRPVKQWQARQESKDLSVVTIRGLLSKSVTGAWMGGVPPHGYDLRYETKTESFVMHVRYMRDGSKQIFDEKWTLTRTLEKGESITVSRSDSCRLALGEDSRQKTIQEIFRLYVEERRGFKAIADVFNRRKLPTPRGPGWSDRYSGKWSLTTVRAILTNPAYTGDMVWNRRTDARFHRISSGVATERPLADNHRLVKNDQSDWIVVPDAHPAIITRRIWELAQMMRERQQSSASQRGINPRTGLATGLLQHDRSRGGWTGPRSQFLLSGLIKCARCGNRYEGHTQYSHKRDANGRRQRTLGYACGGYIRHGRSTCTLGRVRRKELEQLVIESVIDYYQRYTGKEARQHIEAVLDEQVGSDRQRIEKRKRACKKRLKEIEKITRNLLDNITETNRELVDQRLIELTAERENLDQRLESLRFLTVTEQERKDLIDETMRFVPGLKDSLTGSSLDERQATIRRCIDGMDLDSDQLLLLIKIRKLPTVIGGSLTSETETIEIDLPTPPRRRKTS